MRRYDITASIYDARYRKEQEAKIETAMRYASMDQNSVILDIGCGTGILFKHVLAKTLNFFALDISRKTLRQAKAREESRYVEALLADADNLPFKSKIFTHIFLVTVLQNIPKPSLFFREVKRVIKPNGEIIITGLKRVFTKDCFLKLLREEGFDVKFVENNNLQCYIAICRHFSLKSLKV